jgi:hypothetical protein
VTPGSDHRTFTSNKAFGRWGEVFCDDVVAAAMIDRLVYHAEVIALKGDARGSRSPVPVCCRAPAEVGDFLVRSTVPSAETL